MQFPVCHGLGLSLAFLSLQGGSCSNTTVYPPVGQRPAECQAAPVAAGDRRQDPRRLRVAVWNTNFLFDGVEDPPASPWGNASSTSCPLGEQYGCGTDAAVLHMVRAGAVISRLDADIVGLSEVEDCTALARLSDSAALAGKGFNPYLIQGRDEVTFHNVGLLTKVDPDRPGLQRSESLVDTPLPLSKCGFEEEIPTGVERHFYATFMIGGWKVRFFQLHLIGNTSDPRSCAQREAQAQTIRRRAAEAIRDGMEVIIAGDLNDFSKTVRDATGSNPISSVLSRLQNVNGLGNNDLISSASLMERKDRFSFVDRVKGHRLQMDHILVSSGLNITRAWIDHSADIIESFDRFPVVVEIAIDPDFEVSPSGGDDDDDNPDGGVADGDDESSHGVRLSCPVGLLLVLQSIAASSLLWCTHLAHL